MQERREGHHVFKCGNCGGRFSCDLDVEALGLPCPQCGNRMREEAKPPPGSSSSSGEMAVGQVYSFMLLFVLATYMSNRGNSPPSEPGLLFPLLGAGLFVLGVLGAFAVCKLPLYHKNSPQPGLKMLLVCGLLCLNIGLVFLCLAGSAVFLEDVVGCYPWPFGASLFLIVGLSWVITKGAVLARLRMKTLRNIRLVAAAASFVLAFAILSNSHWSKDKSIGACGAIFGATLWWTSRAVQKKGFLEFTPERLAAALMDRVADINAKDKNGETPLFLPVAEGHTAVAKLLIDKGADVNAKKEGGWTPLHLAVLKGHTDTAKLLIAKGADVNARTNDGMTPLHAAAGQGHTEVVKLLIDSGADANAKNKGGQTPLDYAQQNGHDGIVALLLARSRDTTLEPQDGGNIFDAIEDGDLDRVRSILAADPAQANATDEDGWTPLHHAALEGDTEVARLLLDEGANVNAKSKNGLTPLSAAVRSGHTELADLLRKHGANE